MDEEGQNEGQTNMTVGFRLVVAFLTAISTFSLVSWFEKIQDHAEIWNALAGSTGVSALAYLPPVYLVVLPILVGASIGWKATAETSKDSDELYAMQTLVGFILLSAIVLQLFFSG